jgi:EAL domain-containing protein (putative c-di-GMP-specific phosphodiesterase class I)
MGVEALLRWEHPERGLLSAYEFLPAAEGARLMLEIGKWKCAQLERDIALLNQRLLLPLTIAVNLSVSQLETREMQQWIARITDKQFLGLHQLAIEIHEEALVKISGARFMALARLHEMDVLLHLDHFGCNVLPLTTLCSIPFSLLKLDMSLIRHMTRDVSENILVSAAIMLAHHLGIKAGAVGIEEPWQAATLKAHACDTMQGHYTTAPMTADHLAEWLDKRHRMEPA